MSPSLWFRDFLKNKSNHTVNYINNPERVFLLVALFFGIIFLFLTPPFQVPDEPWHFIKSYEVSELKTFGILKDGANGDYLPTSLSFTAYTLMDGLPFHPGIKYNLEKSIYFISYPLNPELTSYTSGVMGFYAPLSYIPQALGISLGKLFNLSPLALMYSGRILNFLVWVILIYSAIRLTPVAKWLFVFLALSPMSLFQAASLSQDASINGVAFLSIALILYYSFSQEKESIKNFDIIILLCPLIFLAFSKGVYSSIALLFLIIPIKKFHNKKDFLIKFCFVVIPVLIVCLSWSFLVKDILIYVVNGWGFNFNDQLLFIIKNPLKFLLIIFSTISFHGQLYLYSFIGTLGWMDTYLPEYVYFIFALSLIFIAVTDSTVGIVIHWHQKQVMVFITLLVFLGIFMSEYLIWNPVGASMIGGPQGRYFIAISPLILLLLYQRKIIINEQMMHWVKLLLTALLFYVLFIATHTIFLRFYSGPLPWIIPVILAFSIVVSLVLFFKFIQTRKQMKENTPSFPDIKTGNRLLLRKIIAFFLLLTLISVILVLILGTGESIGISQLVAEQPVGEIIGGTSVGQTFYSTLPELSSIDIELATWGRMNTKDVFFHLRESPESTRDIVTIKMNGKNVKNNANNKFQFSPIADSSNKSFYFFIDSPESVKGDAITIWSSINNTYPNGSAYINSNPLNGDLTFSVNYELPPEFFLHSNSTP